MFCATVLVTRGGVALGFEISNQLNVYDVSNQAGCEMAESVYPQA